MLHEQYRFRAERRDSSFSRGRGSRFAPSAARHNLLLQKHLGAHSKQQSFGAITVGDRPRCKKRRPTNAPEPPQLVRSPARFPVLEHAARSTCHRDDFLSQDIGRTNSNQSVPIGPEGLRRPRIPTPIRVIRDSRISVGPSAENFFQLTNFFAKKSPRKTPRHRLSKKCGVTSSNYRNQNLTSSPRCPPAGLGQHIADGGAFEPGSFAQRPDNKVVNTARQTARTLTSFNRFR